MNDKCKYMYLYIDKPSNKKSLYCVYIYAHLHATQRSGSSRIKWGETKKIYTGWGDGWERNGNKKY